MSQYQFWLLMFSLWFSLNIQVPDNKLNTVGMVIIIMGVYGSLFMTILSLI